MDRNIRWLLYATVFVTGAAVLVIEVAAVRILSPYYGSSLYVFSSVLTVILGALSAGYYLGGKLSDRLPFHEPLFVIITGSGLATLAMESLAIVTLPQGSSLFTVLSGPLIFGLLLFFTPAFLLGIVSPYIIKLQSTHVGAAESGSVVGTTFFWGTVGSICGSLATGFVLIPSFGINTSIVGTGVVLIALGIAVSLAISVFSERNEQTSVFALIARHRQYLFWVILAAILLIALATRNIPSPFETVLYEADALYSKIIVYETRIEDERIRILKSDTNHSSATSLDSYDPVFGYTWFAEFYPELKPDLKRFLLIGGGAYSIPRTLVARNEQVIVDVVEFEPRLFSLAQKYFDLSDVSRINNFVTDGRAFLNEHDTNYDIIYGDAFGTDLTIPPHLATVEFFEEVRSHLVPEGVFMLNYIGAISGEAPTLTGSLYKTLTAVFPNIKVYAFNTAEPRVRQNIVFVARNGSSPITLPPETPLRNYSKALTLKEIELWTGFFDVSKEMVLTDDRAPVELLMLKQS